MSQHFNQHGMDNFFDPLKVFSGICGIAGGGIYMTISANVMVSLLIAFMTGFVGYLGGKLAGWLLKLINKKLKRNG